MKAVATRRAARPAGEPDRRPSSKGFVDVALAGISAVKSIFTMLIDRGQFVIVLVMTVLLGIIVVVVVITMRLPQDEIGPFFGAFSAGLWQLATLGTGVGAVVTLVACGFRDRAMQAEIDRITAEKKELQAMLTPVGLAMASSGLILDEHPHGGAPSRTEENQR